MVKVDMESMNKLFENIESILNNIKKREKTNAEAKETINEIGKIVLVIAKRIEGNPEHKSDADNLVKVISLLENVTKLIE